MNLHGAKGWLAGVAIAIGVTLLAIIGTRFYGSDGAEEPLTGPAIVNTVATSVAATDDAPAATADTFSVAAGMPLIRSAPGVLENDVGADGGILTAQLVSDTSQGELTLNADGSFSYLPDPTFNGADAFSYTASDGVKTSAAVTVTITWPNVLLILVDDMGLGDLETYNPGSGVRLTNLEALAKAGLRFDNAHASAAMCAPSRYSLMTGNHSYRGANVKGIKDPYEEDTMILPGQQTLGNMMQNANYRTAFIGKLHNGGAFWSVDGTAYTGVSREIDFSRSFDRGPTQFGFGYSFLLPSGLSKNPYAFFENDRLVRYESEVGRFMPFTDNRVARRHLIWNPQTINRFNGGRLGNEGLVMDNYDSRQVGPIMANKALSFIENHLQINDKEGAPRPFFLYLSLPSAHNPNTPPPVFNAENPTLVEAGAKGVPIEAVTPISKRTDMIYEIDVVLGALLDKLEATGMLANTLIIFTSDNGPNKGYDSYDGIGERIDTGRQGAQHFNPQGVANGIPLRGYKLTIYEGGHRVPLLMRWGDGSPNGSFIKPGSVSRQLIGLHDLMATLGALTGQSNVAGQANDSINFLPVLPGNRADTEHIRDHLIVQGPSVSTDSDEMPELANQAFYQRDDAGDLWKLVLIFDPEDRTMDAYPSEFFNLSSDPGETDNLLVAENAQIQLTTMYEKYMSLIGLASTAHQIHRSRPDPINN